MGHIDAPTAVIRALGAAVGVPVVPYETKGMPDEFIEVFREGGAWLNDLQDRAGIGLYAHSTTDYGAGALMRLAAGAMTSLSFADGFERVDMESMRSDRDPDAGTPRWYSSWTVWCHEPPTQNQ